jgi:phosphoadenosine phosphosulfate reductase
MSRETELIAGELAKADRPCVTSSFQAECVVLTHMLREIRPDIPVLFLDTFHHFAETYEYRDALSARWNLNLVNLQAAEPRVGLWQTDTSACCARHKVGPLFQALDGYDVWFTALRRDQSPTRANLAEVEPFALPSGSCGSQPARGVDDEGCLGLRAPPRHSAPAPARQATSIGCDPCTSRPLDPSNPRSGLAGAKLECGIHIRRSDRTSYGWMTVSANFTRSVIWPTS